MVPHRLLLELKEKMGQYWRQQFFWESQCGTNLSFKNFCGGWYCTFSILNSRMRWCSTFFKKYIKERKCGIIPRLSGIDRFSNVAKLMKRGISVCLLFFSLAGCASTRLKDGLHETYFPNGQLKEEMTYLDGQLNGITREYYPTGVFKNVSSYRNGRLDGVCRAFRADGSLESATSYANDQIDGFHNTYYLDDSLWVNKIYDHDIRVERREYDREGYLVHQQDFL